MKALGRCWASPCAAPCDQEPDALVPVDGRWHPPSGCCRLQTANGNERRTRRLRAQRRWTRVNRRQPLVSWCGAVRSAATGGSGQPRGAKAWANIPLRAKRLRVGVRSGTPSFQPRCSAAGWLFHAASQKTSSGRGVAHEPAPGIRATPEGVPLIHSGPTRGH
jgi:hypothetical protein